MATTVFAILGGCVSHSAETSIAVLVQIDRPAGASDSDLKAGFEASLPKYQLVSGLHRKYFIHTDSQFGGVYLWDSRHSADAFFSEVWHQRIRSKYGQSATLTSFDVPAQTKGGSPGSADGDGIVAIVKVAAPWYASSQIIASRMKDSIPEYSSVPGLDHKIYSIAEGRRIGGIYLWDNEAAARRFYNHSWSSRIIETYGEEADLRLYATPVTLINESADAS